MKTAVYDKTGQETGRQAELAAEVFDIEPSDHAIYLDVKRYRTHQRQGTHKAKERGEIVGSTRKIKKQKGTGTARAGSIKNPIFRSGGRIFGPRPKNYKFKLNKPQRRLARKSALVQKYNEGNLQILEDFSFNVPKTKDFVTVLTDLQSADKKSLFVLDGSDNNVYLSSRNFKGCEVVNYSELSTYQIVNADKVFIFEGALEDLQKTLSK